MHSCSFVQVNLWTTRQRRTPLHKLNTSMLRPHCNNVDVAIVGGGPGGLAAAAAILSASKGGTSVTVRDGFY